jgi:hypothetical protein
MIDSRPLADLVGLGRHLAVRALTSDHAAIAAMVASPQWAAANRWAAGVTATETEHRDAVVRGFAIQDEVQHGAVSRAQAELWAVRHGGHARGGDREISMSGLGPVSRRRVEAVTEPLRGADTGPAEFAEDWVCARLAELHRYVLPFALSPAARQYLSMCGVELVTWLANRITELPDGAASSDDELRKARRTWSAITPGAVSRTQSDAARRLWLGTCGNGRHQGRTVGVLPYLARGQTIRRAWQSPALARCWAVAADQADPAVARLPRSSLDRRQSQIRRDVATLLEGDAVRPDAAEAPFAAASDRGHCAA